ncbi:MAG: DUF3237 family protein [Vulcanimicrobiota bacterium]
MKRFFFPFSFLFITAMLAAILSGCGGSSTSAIPPVAASEGAKASTMTFQYLASYSSSATNKVSYGTTPIGERSDISFEGNVTGDLLAGTMKGTDYIVTRSDGITEINARASLITTDGAAISVQITGYCYSDGVIKDTYVRFLTGNENYKWLNNAVVFGEGKMTSNNTFEVQYYYDTSSVGKSELKH